MYNQRRASLVLASLALIGIAPAFGDLIWFDETAGGNYYSSFGDLNLSYQEFIGSTPKLIDFDTSGLSEGTLLSDQFYDSFGVSFLNTSSREHVGYSGIRPEGGVYAEDITGFDGSYMPDGSMVYAKFDNNLASEPFTIEFADPIARVGAFVGMGSQGDTHSLTISVYDAAGGLLGERLVESWLWDNSTKSQNYESFFGISADDAIISRVEIVNNATQDFANALMIDNIAFDTQSVPEPGTGLLLFIAGSLLCLHCTRRR